MANEYSVNQADLVAVADTIRTKGGTSDALSFPGGFVQAVAAIQAGSGGETTSEDAIVEKSLDTEYVNHRIKTVGERVFQDSLITGFRSDSCTYVGYNSFYGSKKLQYVDIPGCEGLDDYAFGACSALVTINAPMLSNIGARAFVLTALKTIKARGGELYTEVFKDCASLESADFSSDSVQFIRQNTFQNCTSLTALILRGGALATLSYTNVFSNTPIESGSGYIYVPASLIDSYKAATNWSTFASQFRAIEDFPEITGG